MTAELGQTRDGGGSSGRLVSGTFSRRRRARIRGGDVGIELDLVRVFSESVDAVRR